MNVRYVLDEWSWTLATDWGAVESAVLALLERLDAARSREEIVGCHPDWHEARVLGVAMFDLIYQEEHQIRFERDTRVRLMRALERVVQPEGIESLSTLDIVVDDVVAFAPGAVWACQQTSSGRATAVLPLPVPGAPSGPKAVRMAEREDSVAQIIHWVTDEAQARAFFRDAIVLEDVTGEALRHHVGSAFPDLVWVDSVWPELQRDWTHFFAEERRTTFFKHLAALDDHGHRIFSLRTSKGRPMPDGHIETELASLGVNASDENRSTMEASGCTEDRTRNWVRPPRGDRRTEERRADVFRWHTKIQHQLGRVHFAFLPLAPDFGHEPTGRIVIGICKDHCKLKRDN